MRQGNTANRLCFATVVFVHGVMFAWMMSRALPTPAIAPPIMGILVSESSSAAKTGLAETPSEKPEKRQIAAQKKSHATLPEKRRIPSASSQSAISSSPLQHTSPPSSSPETGTQARTASVSSGKPAGEKDGSESLSLPRSNAAHLNNPKPAYPTFSRRLGEEGHVQLSIHILADGRVSEAGIKKSSGYARLDQAALEAVRKWRYIPAKRGNEPIPYWYTQTIVFSLNT